MKKMIVAALAVMAMVMMSGCGGSTGPSPQQIQQIDFGSKPRKPKISDIDKRAYAKFKDPSSVKVKFDNLPLQRAYVLYEGKPALAGWYAFVKINAKNSYGAYTGYESYLASIFNYKSSSKISIYSFTHINHWSSRLILVGKPLGK